VFGRCNSKGSWHTDCESRGLIKQASRHLVTVRLNVRMGKTSDQSDLERGMIVGARHAGSSISETASLRGFSERQCLVFPQNDATNQNHPIIVDERGRKRTAGHKQTNNRAVQQWCTEPHLGAHNSLILVTDELLQQTTTPGSTPIR
jgi:hypothetical protein